MKRYLGFLIFFLLEACSNLDPVRQGFVSTSPADPWDPDVNIWYCPRPTIDADPQAVSMLENSTEFDIASLLDVALKNHPLTKLAWAHARSQAFAVGVAESAYYPTLTGLEQIEFIKNSASKTGGTVGTSSSSSPGVAPGTTPGTPTSPTPSGAAKAVASSTSTGTYSKLLFSQVVLSYLLLDFGGRDANVYATEYALESLNWNQNRVIQQVIIGVIQGYYNYLESKGLLLADEENLKSSQNNLEAAELLYQQGIARKLDYLQALANRENALLAVVTAINQVKINLGALAVALGIPPATIFDIKDLPVFYPLEEVEMDIETLLATAKRFRPDLAAANATILQQKMIVESTISSSLPTLSSTVNFQRVNYFDRTGVDNGVLYGVMALNVPIFNGFLYQNEIRQAKENVRAAKASYDNLESLALYDVISSYYSYVTAKESIKYSEDYIKYAQEAYDLALGTYKSGTETFLDLLNAQATLADARSQLVTSRTNWAISLFNIAYSIGTLNPSYVSEETKPK